MVKNGNFGSGMSSWTATSDITHRMTNGVLEFFRSGDPAGAVLQATGVQVAKDARLTLTLGLGNTSSARKRVTVVVHDNDFSDFADCSFWLEPGQALGTHTVKLYAGKAWANATVAVYPAAIDTSGWIRLDDVGLRVTPTVSLVGTECIEASSASGPPGSGPSPGFGGGPLDGKRRQGDSSGRAVPRPPAVPRTSFLSVSEWRASAAPDQVQTLAWPAPIDLLDGGPATLEFDSRLSAGQARATVEVSQDGRTWSAVALVPPSSEWTAMSVDLSQFAGSVIYVRFVYDGGSSAMEAEQWALRNVSFGDRHRQTPRFPLLRFQ
jgi:hypothetical protein